MAVVASESSKSIRRIISTSKRKCILSLLIIIMEHDCKVFCERFILVFFLKKQLVLLAEFRCIAFEDLIPFMDLVILPNEHVRQWDYSIILDSFSVFFFIVLEGMGDNRRRIFNARSTQFRKQLWNYHGINEVLLLLRDTVQVTNTRLRRRSACLLIRRDVRRSSLLLWVINSIVEGYKRRR